MDLHRLGNSDLKIAPIVLGGNVFDWTADRAASFAILDAFVDAGGTMIDTADVYSGWVPGHDGGESERVIGEWLKQSGKRDKVLIATKTGIVLDGAAGGADLSPERIAKHAEASLSRLGTHIDLYYSHRDDPNVPQQAVLEAHAKLVEAGKVRVLGASNFSAARLKSANETALAAGLPHYQVLQPEYNLATRENFEGELQDYCVTHNVAALPYYGLAGGFLTGKYRTLADAEGATRGDHAVRHLKGNGSAILAAMDAVAAETGATLAQIALAWLIEQPGVAAPIASVTSVQQLNDILPAWDLRLSKDQLDRLTVAGA